MKNNRNLLTVICVLFLAGLLGIWGYGIFQGLPNMLYGANCNQNLISTNSIWWNPSYDEPYADLVIYSLSKGKRICINENNPYKEYLIAMIPNIDSVVNTTEVITDNDFQFVGRSNMFANDMFLSDKTKDSLSDRSGIIDVYVDTSSLVQSDIVYIYVSDIGDLYLYGDQKSL